jgi:hypothetical protein
MGLLVLQRLRIGNTRSRGSAVQLFLVSCLCSIGITCSFDHLNNTVWTLELRVYLVYVRVKKVCNSAIAWNLLASYKS